MTYGELENNGFKKMGNWYTRDNISINLFTKILRETKLKFDIDFQSLDNLSLNKIDNLVIALKEFKWKQKL